MRPARFYAARRELLTCRKRSRLMLFTISADDDAKLATRTRASSPYLLFMTIYFSKPLPMATLAGRRRHAIRATLPFLDKRHRRASWAERHFSPFRRAAADAAAFARFLMGYAARDSLYVGFHDGAAAAALVIRYRLLAARQRCR